MGSRSSLSTCSTLKGFRSPGSPRRACSSLSRGSFLRSSGDHRHLLKTSRGARLRLLSSAAKPMLYWLRARTITGPGTSGFPAPFLLASVIAIMILTEFMDFVVLFKAAIVAIFPNVATAGIEERVVPSAIRELDAAVASIRHGGLGLNDWFQYAHRKKQSDECEDHFRIQVNAHVRPPNLSGRFLEYKL